MQLLDKINTVFTAALCEIKGCKYKTSCSPMEITLDQQYYNVGEKPTVILYTYINRHAGTSEKY